MQRVRHHSCGSGGRLFPLLFRGPEAVQDRVTPSENGEKPVVFQLPDFSTIVHFQMGDLGSGFYHLVVFCGQ